MRAVTTCDRRWVVLGLTLVFTVFLGGSTLWADSYDFSTPTGALGTSQTYTGTGGGTITAYGFNCTISGPTFSACQTGGALNAVTVTATNLYGKSAGPGEMGLGIADDPLNNSEISQDTFVNLDLTNAGATSGIFTFDSLQVGESLIYCLGNTNSTWNNGSPGGTCGTLTGNSSSVATLNLNWAGFNDISISGLNQDVLVSSLVTTPEPGTLVLLGTGLLGMAGTIRRKLFKN